MKEKIKVFIWKIIYGYIYSRRYNKTKKERSRLNILSSNETIEYIIENKCSVSRFGDGELQMISQLNSKGQWAVDTFQEYNEDLAKRLYEILIVDPKNEKDHICCLPYGFKDSSIHKGYSKIFFEREWLIRMQELSSILYKKVWGDTNFTRFYMDRKDTSNIAYVEQLKRIWDNRQIILVEGEFSRLGVGNDLFDNAQDIKRIICPATNAFYKYNDILKNTIKYSNNDSLILIALGHTATVLAYDLSKEGLQAIDIGHIDIEYEWLRMKAKHKVPVPSKYVNESSTGRIVSDSFSNSNYKKQILVSIK